MLETLAGREELLEKGGMEKIQLRCHGGCHGGMMKGGGSGGGQSIDSPVKSWTDDAVDHRKELFFVTPQWWGRWARLIPSSATPRSTKTLQPTAGETYQTIA